MSLKVERTKLGHNLVSPNIGHTLNYLGSAFGKVDLACAPPREASSRQLAAMKHLSSILKWFLSSDDTSPPPFEKVVKEGSENIYI